MSGAGRRGDGALLAVVAGTLALVAATPGAAEPRRTSAAQAASAGAGAAGTLRLEPRRVARGERLRVSGRRWPARVRVRLLVGPPASEASPVKTVRTNGRGRFRTRVPIAADARPGRYVMLACRRQCAVKRSAGFRITP